MGEIIKVDFRGKKKVEKGPEKRKVEDRSNSTLELENLRKQERDSFVNALVSEWRAQPSKTREDSKIHKAFVAKYTMKNLETLLDKHRSKAGTYNAAYMYEVAVEYLRRLKESSSPDALEDNLRPLHGVALKMLTALDSLVEEKPELEIRQMEVNAEKQKFLDMEREDGVKALEEKIRMAKNESLRGAWEERTKIESLLGLLYAYLRIS